MTINPNTVPAHRVIKFSIIASIGKEFETRTIIMKTCNYCRLITYAIIAI